MVGCTNCGKENHTVDKCFKFVAYAPDHPANPANRGKQKQFDYGSSSQFSNTYGRGYKSNSGHSSGQQKSDVYKGSYTFRKPSSTKWP